MLLNMLFTTQAIIVLTWLPLGILRIWTILVHPFIFKHIALLEPLKVKKEAKQGGDSVPRELVDNLVAMLGFPEKKIIKALKNCVRSIL